MSRTILLSLLIWLLEILLIAGFVSDQWSREIQGREDKMTIDYFGPRKDAEIRQTSRKWFDRIFVRTGIRESVYRYFIPTEQERQMSKGFEDVGRHDLFPFIESRLNVLWDTLYQMVKRFVMALAWTPLFLAVLFPFVIDGLIRRKISQTNFDYPSPMAHRYSLYVMLGALYLVILGLTLPFPIPPQSVPVGIFAVAYAMNVFWANTQKRI